MIIKDLNQLTQELLQSRLSAGSTSLWNLGSTITIRAQNAIAEAFRSYPFYSQQWTSIPNWRDGRDIVLPIGTEKVLNVYLVHASCASIEVEVTNYRHMPTYETNFLRVQEVPLWATQNSIYKADPVFTVNVEHLRPISDVPLSRKVVVTLSAGYATFSAPHALTVQNPGTLPLEFPPAGYVALYNTAYVYPIIGSQVYKEIVYYSSINVSTGFVVTQRACFGTAPRIWQPSEYAEVYPLVFVPADHLPIIMVAAEANMYRFWLSHRAFYDQFVTASGTRQLDLAELLSMIETLDQKATKRYEMVRREVAKPIPAPVKATARKRKDV